MKDYINKLLNEREQHRQRIADIDKAIEAIQKLCPHNYEESWHDSHHTYYICTECGHEKQD